MSNESEDDDKLPPNWIKKISKEKSMGRPYYVNLATKEVSWKHPKSVRDVHSLDRSSVTISRKNSDKNSKTLAQDRLLALRKDLIRQQKERLKSDKKCSTPANNRLEALQKDSVGFQKETLKSDKSGSNPARDRLLQALEKDLVCQRKEKLKEKKRSQCLVVKSGVPTGKRQWNDKKMTVKPVMQTKTKQKNIKVGVDLRQMSTKSTPISMPKSNDYEGECYKTNNAASDILSDITMTSLSANPSPLTLASSSFSSFNSNSLHKFPSLANSSYNSSTGSTDSYNHHHNDNQRGTNQPDNTYKTMCKADSTHVYFMDDSLKPSTYNDTIESSKPTQSEYLNSIWAHPYSMSATSLFGTFEPKKFSANDRLKNIRENFQLQSATGIESTIHKSPSLTESRLCCNDVTMNEEQISTIDDSQVEEMDWDDEEIFEEISLIRRADDCSDNQETSSINNNVNASNILSSKLFCIVIDTNIFLGQMVFLSDLLDKIDEITGGPKLIIPYIVLQELDKLKMGKRRVCALASRAIRFINTQLNLRNDKILGQSALDHKKKLIEIDSPDDYIVNCCMQLKQSYGHVILLTNDINLRNKAMCSNIESLSKVECEKLLLQPSKS